MDRNRMAEYHYLIVGAGLYGAIFAHEMKKRGKRCLVIDKRDHIGGNCYTEASVPFTRIIEHKHFEFGQQPRTVISREYSSEWKPGDEPYYPVNDAKNTALFARYKALADAESRHVFGGRLADYKYYDMHHVVRSALEGVAGSGHREKSA